MSGARGGLWKVVAFELVKDLIGTDSEDIRMCGKLFGK